MAPFCIVIVIVARPSDLALNVAVSGYGEISTAQVAVSCGTARCVGLLRIDVDIVFVI